jgi:FkbM family methyltransferase
MSSIAIHKDKLVVLGNGPSLRGFDFSLLSDVDSIGMNAAYRYWERISWYPTHYVCLDDQLIETHAQAIYNLIKEKRVKTAFLISKILDYYSDLLDFKNVFYLESFNTTRHKRVSGKGIPYINSLYFKESDSSKVTAGAYSVRFAAHLGYKEISILGVDLRYVEVLPQAASQDGIKLVIKETPKSNPNYFFDDYQRKGDKYNVPNPRSHDRNLHISAFEILANDSIQFGWNIKIFNSNKKSVLYDKAILPFVRIKKFIDTRKLSAIVIPTTPREIDQLERNLMLWDCPLLTPSQYPEHNAKPDLVVAFSSVDDAGLKRRVIEAFENTTYVRRCFDKVRVIDVGLDKALDYYEKDYRKTVQGRGFKSGPNEQFFELISQLSHYEDFIYYMETDCIPLRQGWLDAIRELAEGDSESWVIGAYYRGIEQISKHFTFHLNGNALYRVGDSEFIAFVEQFWRPKLYEILETIDQRMAYDCLLSYVLTAADPQKSNQEWKALQTVGHRFRATALIQNISGSADQHQNAGELIRELFIKTPSTVVAHGILFQRYANQMLSVLGSDKSRPCYWGEMIGEVELAKGAHEYDWPIAQRGYPPMRLLMIDSTPVGHTSATGQLKQTFLGDWPASHFLQIWETGGKNSALRSFRLGQSIDQSRALKISESEIIGLCRKFQPDVIYFRPVDSEALFGAAEQIVAAIDKPFVIHMMDDWPERLKSHNGIKFQNLDDALRRLLRRATQRLSICQAMADAYKVRYGGEWIPLANGVEAEEFPCKDWSQRPPLSNESPFLIRYMGALADDMTYQSVKDVAQEVQKLAEIVPIRLEIYTMDWCREKAERDLGTLPAISVQPLVEEQSYRHSLSSADTLLIAYNFDPASIAYIGLSLANKMPECLASGVPVIAYGPPRVPTIQYLKQANCAQVIDQRDPEHLRASILGLVDDFSRCRQLGDSGRNYVTQNMDRQGVQQTFRTVLSDAAAKAPPPQQVAVVGPFARTQKAHYDETDCIAQLFNTSLTGEVMIDVGAHHGYAHAPFLDRQWQIFAFEPDQSNRAKLLDRLAKHKHRALVTLDTRCVSNQSQKGVAFFTSKQSTGISGLSAFHETHKESQKVDITTLTEFFENRPMPGIDFLKIDTEGHDLFVLQGYPWERGQPAVIECEFEDTKTVPLGYTYHDLARYLVDKGYQVYASEWHPIIRYGIRHDWRALMRYPCELADPKGWGNLLAFRDTIDEQALELAVKKVLTLGTTGSAQAPSTAILPTAQVAIGLPSFRINPGPHYASIGANQWRYTHSEAKQRLWMVTLAQPIGPGQAVTGGLCIQADCAMTVNVTLGSHGRTPYQGATQSLQLVPGQARVVTLTKTFDQPHAGLKLQVEVVALPGGGSAIMTIHHLHLTETPESLTHRLGVTNITLAEANRRLRAGDFATALPMYLWLHDQRPISIYADNALFAARKLGLTQISSIDELRSLHG